MNTSGQQWHLFFSGHVQGVGFRFRTREVARRHGIVGFVRNLPDGRVEVVAEGEPAALQAFLADLSASFAGHITDSEKNVAAATGKWSSFEIQY